MDTVSIAKAWNTCLELITDRGYMPDPAYSKLSNAELEYLLNNNKLDIVSQNNDTKKIICIKFITTEKVKSAYVKELISEIKKNIPSDYYCEIIFVLKNKPNSTIKKLEKDRELGDLQVRHIKEMLFNITKHSLVPPHIKLSDNEIKLVMEKYSIHSKTQFPLILKDDPISRYYNFKSGDIIMVPSSLGSHNSNYINYRCVR
jgi:DNA-directed RNA polymerase subunit H (RpoH/RPB5)